MVVESIEHYSGIIKTVNEYNYIFYLEHYTCIDIHNCQRGLLLKNQLQSQVWSHQSRQHMPSCVVSV